MRTIVIALALGGVIVTAVAAQAQPRFSIEATAVGAHATQDFGSADLDTGFGFGLNARYRFMPHLGAYAGWNWNHYATSALLPGEVDVEETGYALGLRFEHPMTAQLDGWLRAGALIAHFELEDHDGSFIADSKHGLGWEVAAGVTVPLGSRFALTPGIGYRSLTRKIEIGSTRQDVTLAGVNVGTGIVYRFR